MSADAQPHTGEGQSLWAAQSEAAAPAPEASVVRDSVVDNASAAVNAVQNHPMTQNAKETVTNGPMATSVKNQTTKTSNEFSGLASSRTAPSHTAANGQTLTHYHSFFYTLLSWEHPRATAISFGTTILFIFACRYMPILRWIFKISYITLGVTALAEIAGKFAMGHGVTSSFRPRQYYKVPKETLESYTDDLEQLVNFFVIEVQRILFAENPAVTVAAFASAFASYYLIKFLPVWGLTLLSTCIIYLGPLVYIQNRELIDSQISHAQNVVSAQATQVKDLTAQHTGTAFESVKSVTGDYAAKAQGLMGNARQRMPSATFTQSKPATQQVKEGDFPSAPKSELPTGDSKPTLTEDAKPLIPESKPVLNGAGEGPLPAF